MYTAPSSSRSSMTCLSIMLKKRLNRVNARTQSCFTPLTKEGSREVALQPNLAMLVLVQLDDYAEERGWGRPRRSRIIHSPFLLTVSNALVRSTNATYSPLFGSLHFFSKCLRTITMSVIPLLALNTHWVSVWFLLVSSDGGYQSG